MRPERLEPGDTLAHFRIDQTLGHGGMGTVYRATDTRLDRVVALKVMHPALARFSSFEEKLLDEARAMAALEHPRIVPVYEVGQDAGFAYLVMKHVPGGDLATWWLEHRVSEPIDLVPLVDDVCAGLQVIHDAGIVHGDIKPANILLDAEGRATLADLGLARRLRDLADDERGGTPLYIPPERVVPELYDDRPHPPGAQDLYAFGMVLYTLLTGARAFHALDMHALLRMQVEKTPDPPSKLEPSLTQAVDDFIAKALAKAPWERFASAREMAAAFRAVAQPKTRVWVIDDDPDQAEAIAVLLTRRRDVDVKVFFHALSVVEAARTDLPDVLIVDVNMPKLSGLELTAALRERAGADELSIVGVTGSAAPEDWAKLRELGADTMLLKPLIGDQLAAELDRLGRGRRRTSTLPAPRE